MTRSRFLALTAVLMALLGIGMIGVPDLLFARYGFSLTLPGSYLARMLGVALFSLGAINWMARMSPNSSAVRAVLAGNLILHAVSFFINTAAVILDVTNSQGWGAVAFHVALGAGFAYYLVISSRTSG